MKGPQTIRAAVETAEIFEPNPEALTETIARLAALSPIEYDQVRAAEATGLGVRLPTLDEEIARARDQGKAGVSDNSGLGFMADVEPWPDPVDGGNLLDRLTEVARKHLVLPNGAAEAIALWVVHAHAHDCFDISPVLG